MVKLFSNLNLIIFMLILSIACFPCFAPAFCRVGIQFCYSQIISTGNTQLLTILKLFRVVVIVFADRFRELRMFSEPKLKQADLGEKLGMSQRKVSRLETGSTEPTTDEIVKICRFFNVSADYILGLTDEFKRLK